MSPCTLTKLRDAFLSWATRGRSPKTVALYRTYLDRFIAHVGDLRVTELRPTHLLTWGKTWHEIQAVQRLFAWALLDAEMIARNPFTRVTRPRIGQRKRIVDRKTLARMMRRACEEFRMVLVALRETLARPQEVRAFRWEDVACPSGKDQLVTDLGEGRACFVLEEFKARDRRADRDTPRVIPITARLGRLLVRLVTRRPTLAGPIFLNTKRAPYTKNALRCAFRGLRRRLALKPDQRGENVVSYTLRHTLATWATAAGVRDRLLADLLGHTSTRTTRRYQHLQVEHLQDAMKSIHARKGRRTPPPPPC